MQLTLPYPISTNVYFRMFRGRMVTSKAAREYKTFVADLARLARIQPAGGPIALTLVYHPRKPKKATGRPVRRFDADNVCKVACDALNGIAYTDDSQITELHVLIGEPVTDGALNVTVEEKC